VTFGPDTENQLFRQQGDGGRCVDFFDLQEAALAPDGVALAVEELAGRLTSLLAQLSLLALDPVELRDGEEPDGLEAHVRGRGDADGTRRRVDAQVDILDVLEDDVDGDVAELDGLRHQYSECFMMILNR